MQAIVEGIYEAALVPSKWNEVLGRIAEVSSCDSGAMLIIDRRLPPMFAATDNISEILGRFAETPQWYDNTRLNRMMRRNHAGFLEITEFTTDEDRAREPEFEEIKRRADFRQQIGSGVVMPGGETVLFTFERGRTANDFNRLELAWFDSLRPHLARAGLLAVNAQMDRARATIAAFQSLGIPTAIVGGRGLALLSNAAFEALAPAIEIGGMNRVHLAAAGAESLLQLALEKVAKGHTAIQSIALPREDRPGLVLHVLPLAGNARDLHAQGLAMLIASGFDADANIATNAVLRGLFDLSAVEAAVAADIARGRSLSQIAKQRGVAVSTVRTQLGHIMGKTGTARQAELVALLKGTSVPIS
ncbi:helix-turn-helix transcriptional regulator [Jiella sonneratiae]|uniref:Helix-turn-helix transcriptional regulator n=1 Tax=Jiella sonneratiae TaxID=2816856 RepID=A0ABS3J9H9_9HYPH|nr:helix-turn-helix transcriptional regulator [Jiella sonneratiae]MBO0906334.1 helix-turn-helix transcriptional regulator [Jiella sonneratiae]